MEWAGSGPLITVALAYIGLGEKIKLRALQAQLTENADAFGLGLIHAALAEKEEAFREFKKITDWGYWAVLSLHHLYPQALGPLRFDDRFKDLMRQVKLSRGLEEADNEIIEERKKNGY